MMERQADKVAILGAGLSWRQAPFGDPSFEMWGVNAFWRFRPKDVTPENWEGYFSRWFQIHQPGSGEGHIDDPDNVEWMKRRKGPIYMIRPLEEYPGSVAYPIDEVADRFGPRRGGPRGERYFTSTIDYMAGLALLLGFPEIHTFGIDLISDTDDEYRNQRQSIEFYLGKGEGMGVKVVTPPGCALMRSDHVYGFERQPMGVNNLISHFGDLMKGLDQDQQKFFDLYNENKAEYHRAQGAQRALQSVREQLSALRRGTPLKGKKNS